MDPGSIQLLGPVVSGMLSTLMWSCQWDSVLFATSVKELHMHSFTCSNVSVMRGLTI